MEEKKVNINDFVKIQTKIKTNKESIESTFYTEVHGYFKNHLSQTIVKEYGMDLYRLKIGDKLKINPSEWTAKFDQKFNIDPSNDYSFDYKVSNISIEYCNKNIESKLPLIELTIELERI